MAIKNRPSLHTTTRTNIPTPTSAQSDENTILEHILLYPDTYIGSVEKQEQTLWVWQNEQMIKRPISFVPGLYKFFEDILLNAADNTKRNPRLNTIKVEIDVQNSRGIMVMVYLSLLEMTRFLYLNWCLGICQTIVSMVI
ncbi:topoisomerase II [Artemisia annua]|uniref:DNA topoisomerase (ATP-hydrolyzing) n=1 Tax=Artemisia annua TaxID=35608 RepID=A0A2U1P5E6_ARTAN|nr:topoisomerase II [Artemisia annua]